MINMKRCLIVLLTIVTLLLPCGITANAKSELSENSQNMIRFIKEKHNNLLVTRNYYAYMKLGAKWYSDVGVNYCLQMSDQLIDTGSCPNKEKYMEVLINIISVFDMDNASEISNQKKQDNLKSLKDYGMDTAKLAANAVSVYSGLAGIKGESSDAEEALVKAIDGVSVLSDNTTNWIDTLTNLETSTQDYSNYNSLLKCIEENADGELKDAASTLRNSMKQSFLIKLKAYSNVNSENFDNYTQFFFDDMFFDVAKSVGEYQTDEAYRYFVDSSEGLFEKFNVLRDSWDLGKDIGKFIGNITVGAENLINRTFEIEALYDISVILQTKVLASTTEFLNHSKDRNADKYIDEYVTYANFLIGCRIRGEYCAYTVVAEDSGLLSLLSDKTDAQNWYDSQSSTIINLKNRINSIKSNESSITKEESQAKEKMYTAYSEEIKALINKYGDGKIVDDNTVNGAYNMTGLSYAKLIDFDNNGNEELLCVYGPTKDGDGYEKPYYMKVFGYDGKKINTLFEGSTFFFMGTDPGLEYTWKIAFCEENGQILLLTRKSPQTFYIYEWSKLADNKFEVVKSISDYNELDPGEIKFRIDNKEVNEKEFNKQLTEWENKQTYIIFNSNSKSDLENNINETNNTLKILGYDVQENTSQQVQSTSAKWKQAYIDYINEYDKNIDTFTGEYIESYKLVDINGDEIPELYINYGFTAAGDELCSYYDGKIIKQWMSISGFSYIEGQNIFCDSGGLMGSYHDKVYTMENGTFKLLCDGEYGEKRNPDIQRDENGRVIFFYKFNGVDVSYQEYKKSLENVYDKNKAYIIANNVTYNSANNRYEGDGIYYYDEIIEVINNY